MISCKQFRTFVIQPALNAINYYNPDLEELLVAIVGHESKGGCYIHEEDGPALGIYQMEPRTHDDLWMNHILKLRFSDGLKIYDNIISSNYLKVNVIRDFNGNMIGKPDSKLIIYNMFYSTQMAAVFFHRVGRDLPKRNDPLQIAAFWKLYWNTPQGKGLEKDFISNYAKFASN